MCFLPLNRIVLACSPPHGRHFTSEFAEKNKLDVDTVLANVKAMAKMKKQVLVLVWNPRTGLGGGEGAVGIVFGLLIFGRGCFEGCGSSKLEVEVAVGYSTTHFPPLCTSTPSASTSHHPPTHPIRVGHKGDPVRRQPGAAPHLCKSTLLEIHPIPFHLFACPSPTSLAPFSVEEFYEGVDFQSSITRDAFEALAGDFFDRAAAPLRRVLERSGLSIDDIDAVELLGGGSRVPRLQVWTGREVWVRTGGLRRTAMQQSCWAVGFTCAKAAGVDRAWGVWCGRGRVIRGGQQCSGAAGRWLARGPTGSMAWVLWMVWMVWMGWEDGVRVAGLVVRTLTWGGHRREGWRDMGMGVIGTPAPLAPIGTPALLAPIGTPAPLAPSMRSTHARHVQVQHPRHTHRLAHDPRHPARPRAAHVHSGVRLTPLLPPPGR
eukprot:352370-Chlamydomonas_euryale.AAC.2